MWADQESTERLGADRIADAFRCERMREIADVMADVQKLRDRMSAICNRTNTDASDVAAFYEAASEWAYEQQKIWR